MPVFPVELEIILIIFSVIVILLVFKIKYKLNRNSLAFKVFFQVLLSIGLLVELVIIAIGLLNNEFFVVLFALPGGISYAIYVFWYLIKIINNQEKRIQELLKSSSETSINIANIATELASSASEVNAAAEEISSTTVQVANESKFVMESSNKIQKILDIITNISEQTNLLALNASIEAAKAGDFGKGFSVVADEVRKLAEVSRASVENTYDEIKDIINKIHSTTASMEGISASTEEQTSSMEEITATANRLGALAEELKEKLTQFTI